MHLLLRRTHHAQGTNGVLIIAGEYAPLCYCIELPWQDNITGRSCIPPGTYTVAKRYSQKFQWHLHLTDVPGRDLILIHPANNALLELKGCIAPVTELTGPGQGLQSRKAFNLLLQKVSDAIDEKETILLTIIPPPTGGMILKDPL